MHRNLKHSEPTKRNGELKRIGGAKRAAISEAYRHTETSRDKPNREIKPAWDVVRNMIDNDTDPSRMLELYYWTREPGIVELIRAYLDMPETTQRSLGNFLLANKAQSVAAAFDSGGRLVLSRSGLATRDKSSRSREGAD